MQQQDKTLPVSMIRMVLVVSMVLFVPSVPTVIAFLHATPLALVRSFPTTTSSDSNSDSDFGFDALRLQLREVDTVKDSNFGRGSLILSRVESSLGCHDLRQPYFHKAVVLVLDHDPDDFTQGVLLNRASDLVLDGRDIVYTDTNEHNNNNDTNDNDNNDNDNDNDNDTDSSWRIHFGGDIGGWYEEDPQLLCLHGISSEAAMAVSDQVVDGDFGDSDFYLTSHLQAVSLVKAGEATPEMFYTFSGFCAWEKDQLQKEVDRGSWCLVTLLEEDNDAAAADDDDDDDDDDSNDDDDSDSDDNNNDDTNTPQQILRQETNTTNKTQQQQHPFLDLVEKYSWKNPQYKPQSAGLEFWHELMAELGKDDRVGQGSLPTKNQNHLWPFSDLMVKEWATQRLVMSNSIDSSSSQIQDEDIFRALKAASEPNQLSGGSMLRGSASPSSPYLLSGQLFHESTILVLQDTPEASIGVILNLPTKDVYLLTIDDEITHEIPVRYGGYSGKKEQEQHFWFHNHQLLKEEDFGRPVSGLASTSTSTSQDDDDVSSVYVCDVREVRKSIELGWASPQDFLLVRGFCAWEKPGDDYDSSAGGLNGQLLNGNLQDTLWSQTMTPSEREILWKHLRDQRQPTSEECLNTNIQLSRLAWEVGGRGEYKHKNKDKSTSSQDSGTIRHVFDSTVTVSELADDALFVWTKIFLLGNAVYLPSDI